jgi:hypothetical protein
MWHRVRRAAIVALGIWFLWNGIQQFLLLAVGEPKRAVVENVVSSWGARNRVFTVYYLFEKDGREWKGSGSATRRISPGSLVPVRYLSWHPGVNDVDSAGALTLWGCVWGVLGAIAVLAGSRLRR